MSQLQVEEMRVLHGGLQSGLGQMLRGADRLIVIVVSG